MRTVDPELNRPGGNEAPFKQPFHHRDPDRPLITSHPIVAPMRTIKDLPSPKRDTASVTGRAGWYPYYAGFPTKFAEAVLDCFTQESSGVVLDPWNGSGTTTAVTAGRGFEGIGYDLNPVMLVVARARLLNKRERPSLVPIANIIVSLQNESPQVSETDPLTVWFFPSSVQVFRQLEFSVQKALLGVKAWISLERHIVQERFSDLLAFFYVAMFRTVRALISEFRSSNPTWTKAPASSANRLRPSRETIVRAFLKQIQQMEEALDSDQLEKDGKVTISLAASQKLPLPSSSVDFVLSSPPYCTRIDYAAATRPELAVMGVTNDRFDVLRRNLLGTPTVPAEAPQTFQGWGPTCERFLENVRRHPSKASAGYYYKSHCQYFAGIYESMQELHRCLKVGGRACLVVQDSYYKDVHNDLPQIFLEMGDGLGLTPDGKRDFAATRNLGRVNAMARRYRSDISATESIIFLYKN
jgi:DNA modification methylase